MLSETIVDREIAIAKGLIELGKLDALMKDRLIYIAQGDHLHIPGNQLVKASHMALASAPNSDWNSYMVSAAS